MGKPHGAKQQKKLAKQKAKRAQKHAELSRRTSQDPTVRLKGAAAWPVVLAVISGTLWDTGIGSAVIARKAPDGEVVFASYLLDVHCLGVKDAFWRVDAGGELRRLLERMEEVHPTRPIEPACLVKVIKGAVEFARSFGFPPHRDYRHAELLLEGIDPGDCAREYTFGKDGKPFYVNGPNESPAQIDAIVRRVTEAGGHFMVGGPSMGLDELDALEGDDLDEDDVDDESPDQPQLP